jgi:hypothetical protein
VGGGWGGRRCVWGGGGGPPPLPPAPPRVPPPPPPPHSAFMLVCAPYKWDCVVRVHPCAVCSEGALDRCIEDFTLGENKDFVRKEIALSLRMHKRIVPVLTPGFSWPPRLADVPDICGIQRKNGVPWITEYIHACMEKLLKFLLEPAVVPASAVADASASGGGTGSGGGGGGAGDLSALS